MLKFNSALYTEIKRNVPKLPILQIVSLIKKKQKNDFHFTFHSLASPDLTSRFQAATHVITPATHSL